MDAMQNWQAFACTGNIYRYLDYKNQAKEPVTADCAGKEPDGTICNTGACTQRDPV